MADSSTTGIKTLLDYIHIFLRYIASGFVAVGVYFYLYSPALPNLKDDGMFLVFVTATIGFVTYALHYATLDKVFYAWSVMYFLKQGGMKNLPPELSNQIVNWERLKGDSDFKQGKIFEGISQGQILRTNFNGAVKRKLLFALASQTYLRNLADNPKLKSIQTQVESRLAMLNFLYCSFYQVTFILLVFSLKNFDFSLSFNETLVFKFVLLLLLDLLLIVSAIKFNRRICCREMWLVFNFPQTIEKIIKKEESNDPKIYA